MSNSHACKNPKITLSIECSSFLICLHQNIKIIRIYFINIYVCKCFAFCKCCKERRIQAIKSTVKHFSHNRSLLLCQTAYPHVSLTIIQRSFNILITVYVAEGFLSSSSLHKLYKPSALDMLILPNYFS